MATLDKVARPYAKAIFEYALANQALQAWSVMLENLANAVEEKIAQQFLTNPAVTAELQREMLLSATGEIKDTKTQEAIANFLRLLCEYKRLLELPAIFKQFEALRSEHEKTLIAQINSFAPLTESQQKQLTKLLGERLNRNITLEMSIDKSLMGGLIIHAGDFVIDGSVRGQLSKLGADLVA